MTRILAPETDHTDGSVFKRWNNRLHCIASNTNTSQIHILDADYRPINITSADRVTWYPNIQSLTVISDKESMPRLWFHHLTCSSGCMESWLALLPYAPDCSEAWTVRACAVSMGVCPAGAYSLESVCISCSTSCRVSDVDLIWMYCVCFCLRTTHSQFVKDFMKFRKAVTRIITPKM